MAPSVKPAAESEAVLIIDDDALARQMLSDIASAAGFRPLVAASAEQARVLLAEQPRVAFVDFTLPGMSGDAFCHALRLEQETWDLPVVMVTALDQQEVIRRCLTAGADDFILKPVQPHEMKAKLNAVRGGGEPGFQRKLEKKRVLFATQQPFYVKNVSRLFEASGCEVVIAESLEAMDAALGGKARPDVAVLDLDALGAGALERARHHDLPGAAPITLLTMASGATLQALEARSGPMRRMTTSLTPFDAEADRDDILRHVTRALTVGAARGSTRRKMRVPFYAAVRFKWSDEADWTHGIGFDLSESGIFVRTLAPLRPARRAVELSFRIDEEWVSAKATVAWANGFGPRHIVTLPFGMGLSFTDISAESTERIRRYVAQRLET